MTNNKTPQEISRELSKESDDYINSMEKYLEFLKSLPKERAQELAKESLIRAGIINRDKEEITTMWSLLYGN